MKVLLEFNPTNGYLTDANGLSMYFSLDVLSFSQEVSTANKAKDIIALKHSGFSTDEIFKLKKDKLL